MTQEEIVNLLGSAELGGLGSVYAPAATLADKKRNNLVAKTAEKKERHFTKQTRILESLEDADTAQFVGEENADRILGFDAYEVPHKEGDPTASLAKKYRQRKQYAQDHQMDIHDVTSDMIYQEGTRQQLKALYQLVREPGDAEWTPGPLDGYNSKDGGLFLGDKENPLNIEVNRYDTGEKGYFGRNLTTIGNLNSDETLTDTFSGRDENTDFGASYEKGNRQRAEILRTPNSDFSLGGRVRNTAAAFASSLGKELVVDTLDFIAEGTNLGDLGTDAEKSRYVNDFFGYDERIAQKAGERAGANMSIVYDDLVAGKGLNTGELGAAVWEGIKNPELLGQSLGVIAAWVMPGAALTKVGKVSKFAKGLKAIDKSEKLGVGAKVAYAGRHGKEALKHGLKVQSGHIAAAMGNVNDQYDAFVENNGGVELTGADKAAWMARSMGIQMFNQNLDALTATSIIKSPALVQGAIKASKDLSEKQFGQFLTGVAATVGKTMAQMPKEAAQEYSQAMMEIINERYDTGEFKDMNIVEFLSQEGIVKEGLRDAALGAGGAVQFSAAGATPKALKTGLQWANTGKNEVIKRVSEAIDPEEEVYVAPDKPVTDYTGAEHREASTKKMQQIFSTGASTSGMSAILQQGTVGMREADQKDLLKKVGEGLQVMEDHYEGRVAEIETLMEAAPEGSKEEQALQTEYDQLTGSYNQLIKAGGILSGAVATEAAVPEGPVTVDNAQDILRSGFVPQNPGDILSQMEADGVDQSTPAVQALTARLKLQEKVMGGKPTSDSVVREKLQGSPSKLGMLDYLDIFTGTPKDSTVYKGAKAAAVRFVQSQASKIGKYKQARTEITDIFRAAEAGNPEAFQLAESYAANVNNASGNEYKIQSQQVLDNKTKERVHGVIRPAGPNDSVIYTAQDGSTYTMGSMDRQIGKMGEEQKALETAFNPYIATAQQPEATPNVETPPTSAETPTPEPEVTTQIDPKLEAKLEKVDTSRIEATKGLWVMRNGTPNFGNPFYTVKPKASKPGDMQVSGNGAATDLYWRWLNTGEVPAGADKAALAERRKVILANLDKVRAAKFLRYQGTARGSKVNHVTALIDISENGINQDIEESKAPTPKPAPSTEAPIEVNFDTTEVDEGQQDFSSFEEATPTEPAKPTVADAEAEEAATPELKTPVEVADEIDKGADVINTGPASPERQVDALKLIAANYEEKTPGSGVWTKASTDEFTEGMTEVEKEVQDVALMAGMLGIEGTGNKDTDYTAEDVLDSQRAILEIAKRPGSIASKKDEIAAQLWWLDPSLVTVSADRRRRAATSAEKNSIRNLEGSYLLQLTEELNEVIEEQLKESDELTPELSKLLDAQKRVFKVFRFTGKRVNKTTGKTNQEQLVESLPEGMTLPTSPKAKDFIDIAIKLADMIQGVPDEESETTTSEEETTTTATDSDQGETTEDGKQPSETSEVDNTRRPHKESIQLLAKEVVRVLADSQLNEALANITDPDGKIAAIMGDLKLDFSETFEQLEGDLRKAIQKLRDKVKAKAKSAEEVRLEEIDAELASREEFIEANKERNKALVDRFNTLVAKQNKEIAALQLEIEAIDEDIATLDDTRDDIMNSRDELRETLATYFGEEHVEGILKGEFTEALVVFPEKQRPAIAKELSTFLKDDTASIEQLLTVMRDKNTRKEDKATVVKKLQKAIVPEYDANEVLIESKGKLEAEQKKAKDDIKRLNKEKAELESSKNAGASLLSEPAEEAFYSETARQAQEELLALMAQLEELPGNNEAEKKVLQDIIDGNLTLDQIEECN